MAVNPDEELHTLVEHILEKQTFEVHLLPPRRCVLPLSHGRSTGWRDARDDGTSRQTTRERATQ